MNTVNQHEASCNDDASDVAEVDEDNSISILEIAMREEKTCFCICEYNA